MRTLNSKFAEKKNKMKKKKRARTLALLLICSMMLILIISQNNVALGDNTEYQSIVVNEGDTLWVIASSNAPKNTDTRNYLGKILSLNNLSSSIIYPGQELLLP